VPEVGLCLRGAQSSIPRGKRKVGSCVRFLIVELRIPSCVLVGDVEFGV
jgi:hypothetical protein